MKITLAQFIGYASKTTTPAKLKAVREIKNNDYAVFSDYWKPIRDELHMILAGNSTFDSLDQLAIDAPTDHGKRENYISAAKKLRAFFKGHSYSYSQASPAIWSSFDENLTVNATPEFVLELDGITYLIKVNYRVKKKTERLSKLNISAPLLMMEHAEYSRRPEHAIPAVLNLQSGKLFTLKDLSSPSTEDLNAEAVTFVALWSMA